MTRSALLRLLRHGCNAAELAFWEGVPELDMRRTIRALERVVNRRLPKRHGRKRRVLL
jgi:hypothetical protein